MASDTDDRYGSCSTNLAAKTTLRFGQVCKDHHSCWVSYQTPVIYKKSRCLPMSFDKHVEICKASYFHIQALRHIFSSLTTEASTIVILFLQARLHQILLAFSWFRTPLLELLHKSLDTATSRQFWPACTGSLYAMESISKLPQLLSRYCTTSSLHTLLRFFQDTHNTFTITSVLLFYNHICTI